MNVGPFETYSWPRAVPSSGNIEIIQIGSPILRASQTPRERGVPAGTLICRDQCFEEGSRSHGTARLTRKCVCMVPAEKWNLDPFPCGVFSPYLEGSFFSSFQVYVKAHTQYTHECMHSTIHKRMHTHTHTWMHVQTNPYSHTYLPPDIYR